MKKFNQTNPIATPNNIHVQDQAVLADFLNTSSKTLGALDNLGSFIDIVRVRNDFGIKVKNKFLIVERVESEGESVGREYKSDSGVKKKDIFEYPYGLPDEFPEKPIEGEEVIRSTVETHSCEPEETCVICRGAGKCVTCGARGKILCNSCDGTGKKEVRDGSYKNGKPKYKKIGCSRCQGSKYVSCSSCNGTKLCGRCDGSGKVTCDRCDGTGTYQTFSILSTTFKSVTSERTYTDVQEIGLVIQSTKNKVAFDDDLVEWEASKAILFDKRNDAIKENKHLVQFSSRLEFHAGLGADQRLGRVHTTFENVPVTIIDYSFEDKKYVIYIVGENNIVCFADIPKKHHHQAGILTRFINLFTKKKRQVAFLYIASYIFNSDDSMNAQEEQLMELLLSNVTLGKSEKLALREKLKQKNSLGEMLPVLKVVKNDLRALIFAWQCVMQDKKIDEREIAAFNDLANFFKVDVSTLEKLKCKAEKFGKLKDSQLLKEYFI